MAQEQNKPEPTLEEIKAILQSRGLTPIDYKHLTPEQIKRLAGVD